MMSTHFETAYVTTCHYLHFYVLQ